MFLLLMTPINLVSAANERIPFTHLPIIGCVEVRAVLLIEMSDAGHGTDQCYNVH
jgi:hypothetical protein